MKGFVELTHVYYADKKHTVVGKEKVTYNISSFDIICPDNEKCTVLSQYANTDIIIGDSKYPIEETYNEVLRKIELASN